jgi:zeaxanthin glucosyltransferase
MARIGMFCLPGTGHLNPLAALAYELRRRRHSITFFSLADFAQVVTGRGFEPETFGEANYPEGALEADLEQLAEMEGRAAMQFTFTILARYQRAVLEEAGAALTRKAVEFCVIDQLDYAAATLARICRIPFVTVSLALMMNGEDGVPCSFELPSADPQQRERIREYHTILAQVQQPIFELVNQHLGRRNLAPVSQLSEVWSPLAQISQQPAQSGNASARTLSGEQVERETVGLRELWNCSEPLDAAV